MTNPLPEILDGEIEQLASGFVFTEGPLWHPDGFLYHSDVRGFRMYTWSPEEGSKLLKESPEQANGNTFDLQGRLLTCEMETRRLVRTEADGTVTVLADRWQGKRLNRPNDVVCRTDGLIYFTDPGLGQDPAVRDMDFSGVFYITPDGEIHLASNDIPYPNGLAFSPDESKLYLANSRLSNDCVQEQARGEVCHHRYIQVYDVAPDGSLSNSRLFGEAPSTELGVPDGMKVDTAGRVFLTANMGVVVFDSDGNQIGKIPTPEVTANCAFGGDDQRTLYLTTSTLLMRVRVKTPGVKVSLNR